MRSNIETLKVLRTSSVWQDIEDVLEAYRLQTLVQIGLKGVPEREADHLRGIVECIDEMLALPDELVEAKKKELGMTPVEPAEEGQDDDLDDDLDDELNDDREENSDE